MLNNIMENIECFLLVPISNKKAVENFHRSIAEVTNGEIHYKFIDFNELARFGVSNVIGKLMSLNKGIIVWGAKQRAMPSTYRKFMNDDKTMVLFLYKPKNIAFIGSVVASVESEALAEYLWGRDEKGITWSFVYFVAPLAELRNSANRVRDFAESLINRRLRGHTFICKDRASAKFEKFKQFIIDLMSSADDRSKTIRSYTREKLVFLEHTNPKRFVEVLGEIILSILRSNLKIVPKRWCLDEASRLAHRNEANPICNDLRRLCLLSIDSDGEWGINVSAELAPIGEILKNVYEEIVDEEIPLSVEELRKLLIILAILFFEYKDELDIECPKDVMTTRISIVNEQSSNVSKHVELVKYAKEELLTIIKQNPDVIALLPLKLLNLIITSR